MAAQKCKRKISIEIFGIFEYLYTKIHLIKALYSLDSSRSYGRRLENQKIGPTRDLFLPESDFKTSSPVHFPKKPRDFGDLETNQRHETQIRIIFIYPSTL